MDPADALQPRHRVRVFPSLIEVKEPSRTPKRKKEHVGKKRVLEGFSDKARYNLAKQLSRIDWPLPPVHVSLTYHLDWPEDPKDHLERLRKWFERNGWAGVWRLEFQDRKTGPVPHFHLLVAGEQNPAHFEASVRLWWAKVSGNGSPYAVKCTYREAGRAAWYLALHAAKSNQAPKIRVGRWWGWIDKSTVAGWQIGSEIGTLTDSQTHRLRRIARKLTRGRVGKYHDQSFTLFLSSYTQTRLLEYLEKERVENEPF